MLDLIYKSFLEFRRQWKKYIFFAVLYMLLSSYVLIPLLGYFLNRLLLAIGSGVFLNMDVFRIVLDYRGIAGLVLLSFLASIFIFVEVATLIIISYRGYRNREVLVTEALITAMADVKRIVGFGLINLSVMFLLLMPLVRVPARPRLSGLVRIPSLLVDNIMGNPYTRAGYWIGVLIMVYILIRLIFTLHDIVLMNNSVRMAVRNSVRLTRTTSLSILLKLIVANLVLFAAGSVFFAFLSSIPNLVNVEVSYLVKNYLLTLASMLTLAYSLVAMPINVIVLTRLYIDAKGAVDGEEPDKTKIRSLGILSGFERAAEKRFSTKRSIVFSILLVGMAVSLFTGFVTNRNAIFTGRDVMVVSHRGIVEGEFENSLAGIRQSILSGLDIAEIDVQMTRDGVVVLHHDRGMQRTFGRSENVGDLDYEELISLEVENAYMFARDGKIVPTLEEALELANGRIGLMVDVKPYGRGEELAVEIVDIIERTDSIDNLYIQSFDRAFLRMVSEMNPEIRTSQIMYYSIGNLSHIQTDYLTVEKWMVTPEMVRRSRREGKGIWVWNLDDQEDIREVLQYDIDGIITGKPLLLMEILGREVE